MHKFQNDYSKVKNVQNPFLYTSAATTGYLKMYRYRERQRSIDASRRAFGWTLKEGEVVTDKLAVRIKKIRWIEAESTWGPA